jgi:hypothetical protein
MIGGPDQALFSVPDQGNGLEAYRHLLGQPVEVFTASGSRILWGYISAFRRIDCQFPQVIDLDLMANRVSACFEEMEPGSELGQDKQTAWYENLPSQSDFGIKEKVLELGMVSLAQANQTAARYLNEHAWPELTLEGHSLSLGAQNLHAPKDSQPAEPSNWYVRAGFIA